MLRHSPTLSGNSDLRSISFSKDSQLLSLSQTETKRKDCLGVKTLINLKSAKEKLKMIHPDFKIENQNFSHNYQKQIIKTHFNLKFQITANILVIWKSN